MFSAYLHNFKVRFPEGKVFGSFFENDVSFLILSAFAVEGSAQGEVPEQEREHEEGTEYRNVRQHSILFSVIFQLLFLFQRIYLNIFSLFLFSGIKQ